MKVYTIGFTSKSAEEFFNLLKENNVKKVIDIRLNNKSQLAGFTKGQDLKYFLRIICDIDYVYKPDYAPTKELLNSYRNKKINWEEYKKLYLEILGERNILKNIDYNFFKDSCLLCSEPKPDKCHRKLFVEYLKKYNNDINIINL